MKLVSIKGVVGESLAHESGTPDAATYGTATIMKARKRDHFVGAIVSSTMASGWGQGCESAQPGFRHGKDPAVEAHNALFREISADLRP